MTDIKATSSSTASNKEDDTHAEFLKEHNEYLSSHPEISDVMQDFLSDCFIHRPDNIYAFAKQYFVALADDHGPKFTPIVITGPSGVGKGTLIEKLMAENPDVFGLSVSHTTRLPRPLEIPGYHYYFTSHAEMEKGISNGDFLEFAKVHDNLYGTSKKTVADVMNLGKVCILDIDVQGCELVKKSDVACRFVFIAPPSKEELKRRLVGRGTETPDAIERRLKNAERELSYMEKPGFFDTIIVNDNLEKAYEQLKAILQRDIQVRNEFLLSSPSTK
eukprot:TRINITY_DN3613_c0_g1_i1.p1 TRINITY_DN3613_c0_g1~~TRINITY_DN3613_c0_g1_i1.p1  ORF type:complete len:275 (+),score=81.64 TRINITY_DN3613_c0_g1_i1:57-881(+)